MNLKALTISQPYASLIAVQLEKWVENRHWSTKYRGWLAIHAGMGTQYISKSQLADYPTKCVLGAAYVTNCFDHNEIMQKAAGPEANELATDCDCTWLELSKHPHTEGPHCIVFRRDIKTFDRPIRCGGAQGLWTPPGEVFIQLREMIGT